MKFKKIKTNNKMFMLFGEELNASDDEKMMTYHLRVYVIVKPWLP